MAPPSHCHTINGGAPRNGAIPEVETTTSTPAASDTALLLDADEFRRLGHQVVDFIADYYAGLGDYPVHPSVTPGFLRRQLPADAPSRPEPEAFAAALRDVRDLILPGVTHWQTTRHFAHFPASSSTVGALGEALAAGINVVPFTWAASPAATELEMVVVDWLGRALHLPESLLFAGGGGGTILGTSCEAVLCALVAARDRKLAEIGARRIGDLVVYCSDQTHFAFRKAARIAGIPREHCREIPTCRDDVFALSPTALHAAMQADVDAGLVPLFLCATVGTTQTTAVDPVRELCAVAARHGGEYILRDAAAEGHDVVDYKDWGTTLTRRFRALKVWLVLRCYGVEGLRSHVRSHVAMAAAFEAMVRGDARFEVVAPRRFALVCFRLRSPPERLGVGVGVGGEKAANELNRRLLEEVNAASSGPYMSSAMVGGVYMLRCAIGSTLTEERHVREAWKVVQERATSILRKRG
ncbi:hypothetical protein OsJ_03606 [Oryza sativa Japonica Group]|uniref:Uncharacterized protein n=1 Tax=Oryza sativa subsp. japonica TaxID=39947 RepID=B9ET81_ORYSJ|nr:hypothetical protein OsJ_03606 [Oryza sativa Japonica Group]